MVIVKLETVTSGIAPVFACSATGVPAMHRLRHGSGQYRTALMML
jgi:hypothetical protein